MYSADPSTQHVGFLVPTTIHLMVFGTSEVRTLNSEKDISGISLEDLQGAPVESRQLGKGFVLPEKARLESA